MIFENLKVNRIITHEIFHKESERTVKATELSCHLEKLDIDAKTTFRDRIIFALSNKSQSLEMRISRFNKDDFIQIAERSLTASDEIFIHNSQEIAKKLANVQTHRSIPGGVLIVFNGTVGIQNIPFFGVIKAETQGGFRRTTVIPTHIEYVKNIILTPANRLYKIGLILFENREKPMPEGRKAFVFDCNISSRKRENAAIYFYDSFLGCTFPNDGPYETVKFFDLTKKFIKKSSLSKEGKRNITGALYNFIRDEQSPTFTANEFGERFFDPERHDEYSSFLADNNFVNRTIIRDISEMGTRLKRRRQLNFGKDISLYVSPDAMKNEKVEISTIPAHDNSEENWTQVIIHEPYTEEK